MNLNTYTNILEAMIALQKKGFTRTFQLSNNFLKCLQTKKIYRNHELQIVEYHRFKKDRSHPDQSIIFALECSDLEKGYIISSKQNMANLHLLKFMDKVKIQPRTNRKRPLQTQQIKCNCAV